MSSCFALPENILLLQWYVYLMVFDQTINNRKILGRIINWGTWGGLDEYYPVFILYVLLYLT